MIYKTIGNIRTCKSDDYNWIFNTDTGKFLRWGKIHDDDPIMAPMPEILDIEISTICHQGCTFCYKSNTSIGKNMTLDAFKDIFGKFDSNLTQIAFGIGSVDANLYLYDILDYTRAHGVIPNLTLNGYRMKDSDYTRLAKVCGAIATSYYDKDVCFNTVKRLTDAGLKQANIHALFSNETYDQCMELIDLVQTDERLEKLNALVFLTIKEKGDRNTFTSVNDKEKHMRFVIKLMDSGIRFGFDSCSCNNFLKTLKDVYPEKYDIIAPMCESCESSLFSSYINVDGVFFPCSFSEGIVEGIDLGTVKSFKEV